MKRLILCKKGMLAALITLSFLLELVAHAQPLPGIHNKPKNCYIHTTATTHGQDIQRKTMSFDYKTKSECEKMRRILSDNFDPKNIAKSEARMDWRGK